MDGVVEVESATTIILDLEITPHKTRTTIERRIAISGHLGTTLHIIMVVLVEGKKVQISGKRNGSKIQLIMKVIMEQTSGEEEEEAQVVFLRNFDQKVF